MPIERDDQSSLSNLRSVKDLPDALHVQPAHNHGYHFFSLGDRRAKLDDEDRTLRQEARLCNGVNPIPGSDEGGVCIPPANEIVGRGFHNAAFQIQECDVLKKRERFELFQHYFSWDTRR